MLRRGDETVEVFFKDGDMVHATSPIGEGEKAIYYPIMWDEGFFALQANRSASARTIQRSSEQILEAVGTMRRELEFPRVDGRHTVEEIAAALKAPYAETAKSLSDLRKAGLVAVVPSAAENIVSTDLLTVLVGRLTDVMGPMAPIVVRDQIRALGESHDKFPQAKLENLIGLISREITNGKLRNEFEAAIYKARFRRLLLETSEIGRS